MVKIKFLANWNEHLPSSQETQCFNQAIKPDHLKKVIIKIINYFDMKDYLYSFFHALNYTKKKPSPNPFIATHDYCIKVLYFDHLLSTVKTNISPIYHLGLEYPEDYKTKHGKTLDEDALIGLLAKPVAGTLSPRHTHYSYGVDAGILFKDYNISHNKILSIKLEETREGLFITLSCDKHTSASTLLWSEVGLQERPPQKTFNNLGTEVLPISWSGKEETEL